MRLVVVTSSPDAYDLTGLYASLISLVHFAKLSKGRHQVLKAEEVLKRIPTKKKYVDSGGYSIIVGDIPKNQINLFIPYYTFFLDNVDPSLYTYIFSLDIPVLLQYPDTTPEEFLQFNTWSLKSTFDVLESKPSLYDKFIFVWQFKVRYIYDVWCKLYENFESHLNRVTRFAVGGMVGIRKLMGIDFTPFIAPFFRILYDTIKQGKPLNLIHFLGISVHTDRIIGSILQHCLKLLGYDTEITYDTFAVIGNALNKARLPQEVYEVYAKDEKWTKEELKQVVRATIDHWIKEDLMIESRTKNVASVVMDSKSSVEKRINHCILELTPVMKNEKQLRKSLYILCKGWDLYNKGVNLDTFHAKFIYPFIKAIES